VTGSAAVVVLLAGAAALALASVYLYRRFGVAGRVVASDSGISRQTPVLRSARYGLSGRPDYLVEEGGRVVPVEVKPRRRSTTPWPRDVLQLAAYCLLVEETEPRFGGYGYLRYAGRTFRIDFTDAMRADVLRTIAALRADLTATDVDPSHTDPWRCAHCALLAVCGRPVLAE
jgi:CRISPR-associated exonuclease Cas4